MRLEHLLSGVCILSLAIGSRQCHYINNRRSVEFTFLVYPVSEDYDMMIRRNPEAATSLRSVVVQVKVDSPIAQLVRALH